MDVNDSHFSYLLLSEGRSFQPSHTSLRSYLVIEAYDAPSFLILIISY